MRIQVGLDGRWPGDLQRVVEQHRGRSGGDREVCAMTMYVVLLCGGGGGVGRIGLLGVFDG